MAEFKQVLIGIQARSTSSRFPGKVFEMLGPKPVLSHVIDAAKKAIFYMNSHNRKTKRIVNIALLVPEKDEIVSKYKGCGVEIFQGSETDVLSRYYNAIKSTDSDYIVRITGDCPLLPPYIITKLITTACMGNYDYLTNADHELRTSVDGNDCEVISRRMMEYLNEHALEKIHREHVTIYLRDHQPDWAKMGVVIGYLNMKEVKLSVDTPTDLENIRKEYESIGSNLDKAYRKFGKTNVHRF